MISLPSAFTSWVSTLRWRDVSNLSQRSPLFSCTFTQSAGQSVFAFAGQSAMCFCIISLQSIRRTLCNCDPGVRAGSCCVWQTCLCCLWLWQHTHARRQIRHLQLFFLFFPCCHGHHASSQCFFVGPVNCPWKSPAPLVTTGIDSSYQITVNFMPRSISKVLFLQETQEQHSSKRTSLT